MKKEIEVESLSKEELYKNILFLQHERLIHLIVTAFVGILTILFLFGFLQFENLGFCILFLISLILFIPYIFYYYKLENKVQKLQKDYFKKK